MVVKIDMLRCFAMVAEHGSLAEAADRLGRTPSAVSMTLKQLETHLGEPLFETDRKNRLTAVGNYVLAQSQRELRRFDQCVANMEDFANATRGRIRIAAVPSIAGSVLPEVLARETALMERYEIELRDMDSVSILQAIRSEQVDFGIATIGKHDVDLHSELLMSDRFGVIASRGHPLGSSDEVIDWDMLRNHTLIVNSLSREIMVDQSIQLHADSQLFVLNLTSIMGMVRAKIGVTILPEMAARALGGNELVFRPLTERTLRRKIYLVKKQGSTSSPAVRTMQEAIVATIKQSDYIT